MTRYKPTGWRNDSYRHSLAAKGIRTSFLYRSKITGKEFNSIIDMGADDAQYKNRIKQDKINQELLVAKEQEAKEKLLAETEEKNKEAEQSRADELRREKISSIIDNMSDSDYKKTGLEALDRAMGVKRARHGFYTRMSEPAKIMDSIVLVPRHHSDLEEQEAIDRLSDGDPIEALRLGSLVEGEIAGEELHDLTGPGIADMYYGRRLPMATRRDPVTRLALARTKQEIIDDQMKLELDVMTGKISDDDYAKKYKELDMEKRDSK